MLDSILGMGNREVVVWNKTVRLYPNPVTRDLIVEGECDDEWNNTNGLNQQVELYTCAGIRIPPRSYNVHCEWLSAGADVQQRVRNSLRLLIGVEALIPGEYLIKIDWGIRTTWLRFTRI